MTSGRFAEEIQGWPQAHFWAFLRASSGTWKRYVIYMSFRQSMSCHPLLEREAARADLLWMIAANDSPDTARLDTKAIIL